MAKAALFLALNALCASGISVGDKLPSIDLDFGFPPTKINLADRVAGKKVILVPGYLEKSGSLKGLGLDEVIIYCVNDGAVMDAWAKDQGVDQENGLITMMGDPSGALTRALDIELTHEGPIGVGLYGRSKRTAMYVEDGEVKVFHIAEKEDDPAGDAFPESTCAPNMIEAIEALGNLAFKTEL